MTDLFGNTTSEFRNSNASFDFKTASIDSDGVCGHIVITDDKNVWSFFHFSRTNTLAKLIVRFDDFDANAGRKH